MGAPVGGGPAGPVGLQVGLVSAKGSPGVTTLCLALGLAWPGPVVAGELDPAGGDLAARLPVGPCSGVAGLAAAARHSLAWDDVVEFLQPVTESCSLLLGSADPVLAAGAAAVLAEALPEVARSVGVAAVWDLGRLDPSSLAWPAVSACDVMAVVLRPTASGVAHALPLLDRLIGDGCRVGVVVASARRGRRSHPDEEVAEVIAVRLGAVVPVWGRVPFDPLGVSMAERIMPRWAGRCPVGASARALHVTLAGQTDQVDGELPGDEDEAPGNASPSLSPVVGGVVEGDGEGLELSVLDQPVGWGAVG